MRNHTWHVVAEDKRTGAHYLLATTPDKGNANKLREKFQAQFTPRYSGAPVTMAVTILRSV